MLTISQSTGQVEAADVVDGGDILVSFKSRSAAEQVRVWVSQLRYTFSLSCLGSRQGHKYRHCRISSGFLVYGTSFQREERTYSGTRSKHGTRRSQSARRPRRFA